MSLTKTQMINTLNELKEEGLSTQKYFKEVMLCEDNEVPYSTIAFINKHRPIDTFYSYNKVYENRKKNPLYKNLVNENLSLDEKAIALSSFNTQALIRIKELRQQNRVEEAKEYAKIMNISEISSAVIDFSNGNDEKLKKVSEDVRKVFKTLF